MRTLWGELAWQLGGKEGYAMVKEADETATNPGDVIGQLLRKYSPCLILIDEWVAYARQLHEQKDLPGGDFETHFTFADGCSSRSPIPRCSQRETMSQRHSANFIATSIRNSRRNAVKPTTNAKSKRPTRFTRRFLSGSIKTGQDW
ncbi:MAG: DUF499 domain-containing protein [Verrucomicrobiota bacterium]